MANVVYTEEGSIAIVSLNRPECFNRFSPELRAELLAALQHAADSCSVRAVLLSGVGRAFSSGADLTESLSSPEQLRVLLEEEYNAGILTIMRMNKPVVAAVSGCTTGIAVAYALACDFVLMGMKSYMQLPFARLGLVPNGGLCWQLVHRLGYQTAFELAINDERLSAERCHSLRLVNRVVPDGALLEEAITCTRKLATRSAVATLAIKQALWSALRSSIEESMRFEARLQQGCMASADFSEGMRAVAEKRMPRFVS